MTGMVSESRTPARSILELVARWSFSPPSCGVTPGTSKDTAATGSMRHLFPEEKLPGRRLYSTLAKVHKILCLQKEGFIYLSEKNLFDTASQFIPTEEDSSLVRTSASVGITMTAPVSQTSRCQLVSLLPLGAGPQQGHGLHYVGDVQRASFLTDGNLTQAPAAFRGEESARLWLEKQLKLDASRGGVTPRGTAIAESSPSEDNFLRFRGLSRCESMKCCCSSSSSSSPTTTTTTTITATTHPTPPKPPARPLLLLLLGYSSQVKQRYVDNYEECVVWTASSLRFPI